MWLQAFGSLELPVSILLEGLTSQVAFLLGGIAASCASYLFSCDGHGQTLTHMKQTRA